MMSLDEIKQPNSLKQGELQDSSRGSSIWLIGLGVLSVLISILITWAAIRAWRGHFPDVGRLQREFPVWRNVSGSQGPRVEWTKVRPSHWVDLKQVSRAAIGAVVVSEDWAFYQHPGYDLEQIKKVLEDDLSLSRGVEGLSRGASTITQQMVKNVFLSRERTLVRKVKELILAVEVERRLGKAKILEVYLNIAEWGEGIYGIREAAQFYFHKSPKELSAKEGAFLAMLLPSPKRYSQSFRAKKLTHYARKTTQDILSKMRQAKWITDEIHAAESARPLAFEVADAPDSKEESEEASPTVEDPSVPLAPEELFEVPHDSPSE